MTDTRRFTHDCEHCSFHGHMQGYDVYTCESSLVLRYGSDGPEYQSLPMAMVAQVMQTPQGQLWSDAIEVIGASVWETVRLGLETDIPKKLKPAFMLKVDSKIQEFMNG